MVGVREVVGSGYCGGTVGKLGLGRGNCSADKSLGTVKDLICVFHFYFLNIPF